MGGLKSSIYLMTIFFEKRNLLLIAGGKPKKQAGLRSQLAYIFIQTH